MSFSDFDFSFPVVMTSAGAQPTPPATLLAQLIASVSATNPGYTVNLPGALIEDVSSTAVGALVICDGLRVETINSLTYLGANDFLLLQLGQMFIGDGSAPAPPTNTSVFVIFTATDASSNPLPGQVIARGFTVSDGTYQYIVQDGGVTDASGQTQQLFCVATVAGSWAVPTNSVTQVVTSPPPNVNIACTNPSPGVAAAAAETAEQYRARVMQAGRAIATGTQNFLKTLLGEVPGVQQNLISIIQETGGWKIICGGGDPYLTAGAIYASGIDISTLVGSEIDVTNITQANPGVVTTDINHGLTTGQSNVQMNGIVGMTELNGVFLTVTVISEKEFSVGLNTSGYNAYVSGGVVTPNSRNIEASLFDWPDTYTVLFVNPPAQTVTMDVTYGTTVPNFASQAAVAQLGAPAIAEYVSSIAGPGAPINLLVAEQVFLEAISSVINPSQISSLSFEVFINSVSTAPTGDLVYGDPESYFSAASSGINILEG